MDINSCKSPIPDGITPMTVTAYLDITADILDRCGIAYVQGEISELKKAKHLYFQIRDDSSVVNCILWSNVLKNLDFEPAVGDKVIVCGKSTIYARSGRFSLQAHALYKQGLGYLMQQLKQLQQKLAAEGVFSHPKRKIPDFVNTVGVITSKDGKAVHDIQMTLNSRNNGINILVYDARVQGPEAPASLIRALNQANSENRCDVLIIGRGGGSFEDLLAFSDEAVVRAVADSKIPIISAVGHEPDIALTDFAADVRASTPSVAANLVSAITKDDIYQSVEDYRQRIEALIVRLLQNTYINFKNLESRFQNAGPLNTIKIHENKLNSYVLLLDKFISLKINDNKDIIAALKEKLIKNAPELRIEKKRSYIAAKESYLNNAVNARLQHCENSLSCFNERLNKLDLKELLIAKKHDVLKKEMDLFVNLSNKIHVVQNQLSSFESRLSALGVENKLHEQQKLLSERIAKLQALNPLSLLKKGYTLTVDEKGNNISFEELKIGDALITVTNKGRIKSQILEKETQALAEDFGQ